MVLLGILAIVLGAFLVDIFVMYDSVNAAVVRLNNADREASARAVTKDTSNFLSREGVEQAIGFKPTTSKVENGQLIEHYRWWGSLPLERRFIMVKYTDEQGKRYASSEVNNRNIFGEDVDEDAVNPDQQSPPGDPGQPPEASPMPMGITGPPVTSGNDSEDKEASPTPDTKESSPATDSTDEPSAKTEESKDKTEGSKE
jgi:hypothetical protein